MDRPLGFGPSGGRLCGDQVPTGSLSSGGSTIGVTVTGRVVSRNQTQRSNLRLDPIVLPDRPAGLSLSATENSAVTTDIATYLEAHCRPQD